jgi:uncharacterized RmlC-like cupin family protein
LLLSCLWPVPSAATIDMGSDAASHINQVKAGDVLYLERGLTHSESTLSEHQSAVYTELK